MTSFEIFSNPMLLIGFIFAVSLIVFTLAMSCYARKKVKEEEKLMRRQNEIIAAQRKQCEKPNKRLISVPLNRPPDLPDDFYLL